MIDPSGQDLKSFLAGGADDPCVMLNLLRFNEDGESGYQAYLRHFRPFAEARGARILHYGRGATPLVAEEGQAWDAVLVVHYPSRRSFSEMVRDPAYQAGAHLRTESLVEAVLQPTIRSTSEGHGPRPPATVEWSDRSCKGPAVARERRPASQRWYVRIPIPWLTLLRRAPRQRSMPRT